MDSTTTHLPYGDTGFFSKIITDYLGNATALGPFYRHPVSIDGIKAAVEERKNHSVNRTLLVSELKKQYSHVAASGKVMANIELLAAENTFTICTAHQPNIFTGHLYFVYKILHAVKMANALTLQMPGYNFVPVYYMGSEDADLEELGHVYIRGEKMVWDSRQSGAFGRMKVDAALVQLIESIAGQLLVYENGEDIIHLVRSSYRLGTTIEQASFTFIHALFADYGLVVLLPDNTELKRAFIPVMQKELTEGFSQQAVAETISDFPTYYKIQAGGRELNLFYLGDQYRERIIRKGESFMVQHRSLQFTHDQILAELQAFPERFSPNVILRPVFQELILPNVAFIGGGGEIAYWLELQKVFEAVRVPFPVLILRNSFLIINAAMRKTREKLGFAVNDLFKPTGELLNELVMRESKLNLSLEQEKQALAAVYRQANNIAGAIDSTLSGHARALGVKALDKLTALEKKMLKAERKKFEAVQRQLQKLKAELFPHNNLQERIENILLFYARWGKEILAVIEEHSAVFEQEFCIIEEQ